MPKKILIINGHPDNESFNHALSLSYEQSAKSAGAEVFIINICELKFDPNLKFGYKKDMELEIDLKNAVEKLKNADHLVFIHPVWWGSYPALMKGFIDRVFLPEITFSYDKNNKRKMLLSNKSAHIIATMDAPVWYYKLILRAPSIRQLKNITLNFCGIKRVNSTCFGLVLSANEQKRKKWLQQIEKLALKDAGQ
jgi:putative NADPH-quinone reductase